MPTDEDGADDDTGPRRPRPDYSQASGAQGSPPPTPETVFLQWLAGQTDGAGQPYLLTPWRYEG